MEVLSLDVLKEIHSFKKNIIKLEPRVIHISVNYYDLLIDKNRLNLYVNYSNTNKIDINLGLFYMYEKNNLKKAEKYFLNCHDKESIFELAKIYHINKRYDEAIKLYKKCLEYNIVDFSIMVSYYLGFLYQEIKDYFNMEYYYTLYRYILDNKDKYHKGDIVFCLYSLLNLGSYYQFISKDFDFMKDIYKTIVSTISEDFLGFYKELYGFILINAYLLYGLYYESINFTVAHRSLYFDAMKRNKKHNFNIDMFNIYKRLIYLFKSDYFHKDFYNTLYQYYNIKDFLIKCLKLKLYDNALLLIKNMFLDLKLKKKYIKIDINFLIFIIFFLYRNVYNNKKKSKKYFEYMKEDFKNFLPFFDILEIKELMKPLNITFKDIIDIKNILLILNKK